MNLQTTTTGPDAIQAATENDIHRESIATPEFIGVQSIQEGLQLRQILIAGNPCAVALEAPVQWARYFAYFSLKFAHFVPKMSLFVFALGVDV